jgi:hypothetical protein
VREITFNAAILDKARQNFILDAFSEISVIGIATEVIKR